MQIGFMGGPYDGWRCGFLGITLNEGKRTVKPLLELPVDRTIMHILEGAGYIGSTPIHSIAVYRFLTEHLEYHHLGLRKISASEQVTALRWRDSVIAELEQQRRQTRDIR